MHPPFQWDFHDTSTRLILILSSAVGALIMEITYSMDIRSHEDKFLKVTEHIMEYAERALVLGEFLVDTFPIHSSSP